MVTVEQDQETLVELRQKKRVIGELIGAHKTFIVMPSHLDNPDEALQPTQARQIKLLLEVVLVFLVTFLRLYSTHPAP